MKQHFRTICMQSNESLHKTIMNIILQILQSGSLYGLMLSYI